MACVNHSTLCCAVSVPCLGFPGSLCPYKFTTVVPSASVTQLVDPGLVPFGQPRSASRRSSCNLLHNPSRRWLSDTQLAWCRMVARPPELRFLTQSTRPVGFVFATKPGARPEARSCYSSSLSHSRSRSNSAVHCSSDLFPYTPSPSVAHAKPRNCAAVMMAGRLPGGNSKKNSSPSNRCACPLSISHWFPSDAFVSS